MGTRMPQNRNSVFSCRHSGGFSKYNQMDILELNNIHKSFGNTHALKGVSFSIPEGSIFGILGPNGSGKTTLLGIILDVLNADEGIYHWFGGKGSENFRHNIGALLETPNFYHYMSAERNLEITQRICKRGTREDIDHALRMVQLFQRRKSKFSTFSLGMKQRLAIGAALLASPAVLVLDEPTNGLDPEGIAEIRELIVELKKQGHTIIIASHLLDEVEKVCTHVAIMKNGVLLSSGSVGEILTDEDWLELGAKNLTALQAVMRRYPGLRQHRLENDHVLFSFEKNGVDAEAVNDFCYQQGVKLTHMVLRKQRLEARFFELTQN